jgi:hypothetical protein
VERLLPPGTQCWNVNDLVQRFDVAVWQIQQRVDIGDTELVRATACPHDVVTGLDPALGDDAEVKPWTVLGDKKVGHFRFVEPQPDPEAGDPRLGDLENRAADPVPVADADLIVGQPLYGEVLPELPVGEVIPAQLLLPVLVGRRTRPAARRRARLDHPARHRRY